MEMQRICDRIGAPSCVPSALRVWTDSSKRIYKSAPAATVFICACVVMASGRKRVECERVLMAANLQPSPEHVKLLLTVIKKIKRALNYKATLNIYTNVEDGVKVLLDRLDRLAHPSDSLADYLTTLIRDVQLNAVRSLALEMLAVAKRSGYLKNRRRANPIAVAVVMLAIESQPVIVKFKLEVKVDLIKILGSLIDGMTYTSLEAVNNRTIELLSLLRKLSKVHTPWIEADIQTRHPNRADVTHRYKSMVWVADVVRCLHASDADLEDCYTPEMSRSRFEKKKLGTFAAAAVAFVKENQQVVGASIAQTIVSDIEKEFASSSQSKTSARLRDRNADDVSDADLFSDDELASYIRTHEEAVAKQIAVGDRYDHEPAPKRVRKEKKGEKRRTKAVHRSHIDNGGDDNIVDIEDIQSDISEQVDDMIES
ncbi:hypothetical protein E3P99_00428 [Wallemia hederae]|uniref:Uncharacterized protein n=1 Tax=Wallemia hederae TaxID=1540922 RepID=A0A4T0FW67_9BASI|nr:hypothetical protein E3P99_00428 [Wallemia hederae]